MSSPFRVPSYFCDPQTSEKKILEFFVSLEEREKEKYFQASKTIILSNLENDIDLKRRCFIKNTVRCFSSDSLKGVFFPKEIELLRSCLQDQYFNPSKIKIGFNSLNEEQQVFLLGVFSLLNLEHIQKRALEPLQQTLKWDNLKVINKYAFSLKVDVSGNVCYSILKSLLSQVLRLEEVILDNTNPWIRNHLTFDGGDLLPSGLKKMQCLRCSLDSSTFNSLPLSLESLIFSFPLTHTISVLDFDFARLENLHYLDVSAVSDLTLEQFYSFPKSLKTIRFPDGFLDKKPSLFFLENLETFYYKGKKLDPSVFNSLPISLKDLHLCDVDVTSFNFAYLENLQSLHLNNIEGLRLSHLDQFPVTLRQLFLPPGFDVKGYSFSRFVNLHEINLRQLRGLSSFEFNSFSKTLKEAIKELILKKGCDVNGFDFSSWTSLNSINFSDLKGLRKREFNSCPFSLKQQVKDLHFEVGQDISGFDFSDWIALEKVNFQNVLRVSSRELNTFHQKFKDKITQIVFRKGDDLLGLDFSSWSSLKQVDFSFVDHLSPEIFNTLSQNMPEREIYLPQNFLCYPSLLFLFGFSRSRGKVFYRESSEKQNWIRFLLMPFMLIYGLWYFLSSFYLKNSFNLLR